MNTMHMQLHIMYVQRCVKFKDIIDILVANVLILLLAVFLIYIRVVWNR